MNPQRFDALARTFARFKNLGFSRRRMLEAAGATAIGVAIRPLGVMPTLAQGTPLLAPTVVGPLSECNGVVWVKHQLTGATVEVFVGSNRIASRVASWPSEGFALDSPLNPGDEVTATQTLDGVTSDPSPSVIVQSNLPDMDEAYVNFRSAVYECSRCASAVGAVPGATVQASIAGDLVSQAVAPFGNASLLFDTIPQSRDLELNQIACGVDGPVRVVSPEWDFPGHSSETVVPPKVEGDLVACMRSVPISGALSGAIVTISRNGISGVDQCFESPSESVRVSPLTEGEVIVANQGFVDCNLISEDSQPVTVMSADSVPSPRVRSPLCAGDKKVMVWGLTPGAVVRLFRDDVVIGDVSAGSSSEDFNVPRLEAGDRITAEQRVCDPEPWSDRSLSVTVLESPGELPVPELNNPLYSCGTAVRVNGLRAGSTVSVQDAATGAARSDVYFVDGPFIDVAVRPSLQTGEELIAIASSCGESVESPPQIVLSVSETDVGWPEVTSPLLDDDTSVKIQSVVPGALVDVWINGIWSDSAQATTDIIRVPLTHAIHTGDEVAASQRICDTTAGPGRPVTVRPKPPAIDTNSPLPSGEVGQSYFVKLRVRDGVAPFTWRSSRLPAGIELDTSAGELRGTPTESGSFAVTLEVEDSGVPPLSGVKTLDLRIDEPAPVQANFALRYPVADGDASTTRYSGAFYVRFVPLRTSAEEVLEEYIVWEQLPREVRPGSWYVDVYRIIPGLAPGTWRVDVETPRWRTNCEAELEPGVNLVHFEVGWSGCSLDSLGFPGDD